VWHNENANEWVRQYLQKWLDISFIMDFKISIVWNVCAFARKMIARERGKINFTASLLGFE
jgi:IS30 family transposase